VKKVATKPKKLKGGNNPNRKPLSFVTVAVLPVYTNHELIV